MRILLAFLVMFGGEAMAAAGAPSVGEQLIPLVLIFVIFYFLILRPQSKKMKDHRAMAAALGKGDVVITAGGIVGKVVATEGDDKLRVELADGVEVLVIKSTVSDKLSDEAAKALKKAAPKTAEKKPTAKKSAAKKAPAKKTATKK